MPCLMPHLISDPSFDTYVRVLLNHLSKFDFNIICQQDESDVSLCAAIGRPISYLHLQELTKGLVM